MSCSNVLHIHNNPLQQQQTMPTAHGGGMCNASVGAQVHWNCIWDSMVRNPTFDFTTPRYFTANAELAFPYWFFVNSHSLRGSASLLPATSSKTATSHGLPISLASVNSETRTSNCLGLALYMYNILVIFSKWKWMVWWSELVLNLTTVQFEHLMSPAHRSLTLACHSVESKLRAKIANDVYCDVIFPKQPWA
jgi:hypothetical protein